MPAACSSWAAANGSTHVGRPAQDDLEGRVGGKRLGDAVEHHAGSIVAPHGIDGNNDLFVRHIENLTLAYRSARGFEVPDIAPAQTRRSADPFEEACFDTRRGNAQGQDQVHQSLAVSSGSRC